MEERPREKLLTHGAEKLSDAELVAILLGTGRKECSVIELARELLHHCEVKQPGAALRYLLELRSADLKQVARGGIGEAKLCQLIAAVHLGMRASRAKLEAVDLNNPRAVFEFLADRMAGLEQEEFMVILLNAKNSVLGVESITRGTLTASLVHPREVFRPAIRRRAHAIILAHNHPSGDPSPSREDREVTKRLIEAGKLIGIEVLDHLIVGNGRYTSFRERGLVEWS